MISEHEMVQFSRVILDRVKVAVIRRFPELEGTEFYRGLDARVFSDFAETIAVELSSYIYAEKFEPKTEMARVEVYQTWWDHLKGDVFPKWLLHRFPAKTRIETVSLTVSPAMGYPQLPARSSGGVTVGMNIYEHDRSRLNVDIPDEAKE